jgi:hypothetical protein
MVTGFRLFPPLYDLLVGPLMSRITLAREPVPATAGNVLHPVTEDVEVRT